MNTNISQRLAALVKAEGGYTNNPKDKGGETNFGITVETARVFGYMGPMKDLPLETALFIYTRRYWQQPGFDKIEPVSDLIAGELLDTGVNMGQATAGKFLQRCLNVLDQQGKLYSPLTVDGSIGLMTVNALKQFLTFRGSRGEQVLLGMMNHLQGTRYIELAEADPTQEEFEFGWQANRTGV